MKQLCLFFVLLIIWELSFVSCNYDHSVNYPTVTIRDGKLRGIYFKSRGGRPFAAFMGIPYANPPGKFEPAVAASSWPGTRNTTEFGSVCAQFDVRIPGIIGSQDCLFLNVFTPNVKAVKKMAVLVFIHGGGFQYGSSNENGPDYLMDEDVVYVSLNYRLGPFGFASLGDATLPGNLGLKDQVLALKWIQKNIKHFGGNSKCVTLSGESSGGAAVGLHIVSPLSRGLFHRAISSSGSAFNTWAITPGVSNLTIQFAQRLNCPISSSIQIKLCLQTKTIQELYSIPSAEFAFGTTIEPIGNSGGFLSQFPEELYKNGQFAKVPLLITANEAEGLLLYSAAVYINEDSKSYINQNWNTVAPFIFDYSSPKYNVARKKQISKNVLQFYFGRQNPPLTNETFVNFTNALTDSRIIYGVREALLQHARYSVPTYAAILSFDGIWSQIFYLGYTKPLGMTHADDLQYLLSNPNFPLFPPGSAVLAASHRLIRIYTNFAQFGDPNIDQNRKVRRPISDDDLRSRCITWMYLKNKNEFANKELLMNRMKFWDKIY